MRNLTSFTLTEVLSYYNGSGMYIALFLVAVIYLYIRGTKEQKTVLVYPVFFMFLTIFNPLLAPIFVSIFGAQETYYRIFWALPIIILIAYTISDILSSQKKHIQTAITAVLICLTIIISGAFCLTEYPYYIPENKYKISSETIIISNLLRQYDANPKAVLPDEHIGTIREYDASVRLTYGRSKLIGQSTSNDTEYNTAADYLYALMHNTADFAPESFMNSLRITETEFIALPLDSPLIDSLYSVQAVPLAQTDHVVIFDCRNLAL